MKTKLLFFLIKIFICKLLFSQSNVLLTFSAQIENQPIPLDSVRVKNLTQGVDTIVYFPDTILVLSTITKLDFFNANNSFFLGNVYPNPFEGYTSFYVDVHKNDRFRLSVFDVLGRKLFNSELKLEKGRHSFTFTSGASNLYFLSVESTFNKQAIKLVCNNISMSSSPNVTYDGLVNGYEKRTVSNSNFTWIAGDTLKILAYSTIGTNSIANEIVTDNPSSTTSYQFNLYPGLRCFDEPHIIDSRDGNIYRTVQIGNQCWMAENLRYLPAVFNTVSGSNSSNRYWVYGYDGVDVALAKSHVESGVNVYQRYGVLYNYYAATAGTLCPVFPSNAYIQGVCPHGWHIPNWSDVKFLRDSLFNYYLLSDSAVGSALSFGNSIWFPGLLLSSPDFAKTGFRGLPGGYRKARGIGINPPPASFNGMSYYTYWWRCETDFPGINYYIGVNYNNKNLILDKFMENSNNSSDRQHGAYVRCVRNY